MSVYADKLRQWRHALPASVVETLVGAAVIAVAALCIAYLYTSSGIKMVRGYTVTARFDHAEGIRAGTDVRISGIKVGSVLEESLEPDTYFALVTLSIDNDVKLPKDSDAKIVTEGLLGNKYVEIHPGAEETLLMPGGEITHTQSPIDLEGLLGRYVFGGPAKH